MARPAPTQKGNTATTVVANPSTTTTPHMGRFAVDWSLFADHSMNAAIDSSDQTEVRSSSGHMEAAASGVTVRLPCCGDDNNDDDESIGTAASSRQEEVPLSQLRLVNATSTTSPPSRRDGNRGGKTDCWAFKAQQYFPVLPVRSGKGLCPLSSSVSSYRLLRASHPENQEEVKEEVMEEGEWGYSGRNAGGGATPPYIKRSRKKPTTRYSRALAGRGRVPSSSSSDIGAGLFDSLSTSGSSTSGSDVWGR